MQDEESSGAFASYDTLQFLKARLTEAEVANRQASHSSVFGSYMDIANHYQGQHDYQTAIYFLTKALDVARLANDVEREADANQMLGLAHERMGNLRTAIEFHEKRRDLVTASGVELTAENGRHLIGAYKALAEELQRTGDYVAAIGYYERSLEAAKSLQDYAGEGLAYQQLGNAYLLQKDYSMAADCFKKFLLICQETDDKIAEGSACSALASAYEALGDRTSSIKYLEAFYEVWPPPITSPFHSPLLLCSCAITPSITATPLQSFGTAFQNGAAHGPCPRLHHCDYLDQCINMLHLRRAPSHTHKYAPVVMPNP